MIRSTVSLSLSLSLVLLVLAGCGDPSLLVSDDQVTGLEEPSAFAKNDANPVPFKGTWINTSAPPAPPEETPADCEIYITTSQVGRATHLGDLTGSGITCGFNVRIVNDPPLNLTGGDPPFLVADFTNEMTWMAANGDQLFLSPNGGVFVQSLTDGTTSIEGFLNFNGGTGRFARATGHADVLGTGDANVDRLQFNGLIEYDASHRSER